MTPVLLQIFKLGNLLVAFIVPAVEAALRIKHLLELDPDLEVSLRNLAGTAIEADEGTLTKIREWRARVGLPT